MKLFTPALHRRYLSKDPNFRVLRSAKMTSSRGSTEPRVTDIALAAGFIVSFQELGWIFRIGDGSTDMKMRSSY
jgi:hypothetical protein